MKDSNKPEIKTDYAGHDAAYKHKKAVGLPGWDDKEGLTDQISQLQRVFLLECIPQAGRVLDVGCGAGNISFWLESLGFAVTGIDVSSVAIEWAKEQASIIGSKVLFSVENVAQKQYVADKPYDIVLDNHCLHCIIGNDRELYLRNIFNNLKSSGVYICNTMCDHVNDPEVLKYFDAESRLYFRNNIAIRYIGRHEDIINEIIVAGFEIIRMELLPDDVQNTMCVVAYKS